MSQHVVRSAANSSKQQVDPEHTKNMASSRERSPMNTRQGVGGGGAAALSSGASLRSAHLVQRQRVLPVSMTTGVTLLFAALLLSFSVLHLRGVALNMLVPTRLQGRQTAAAEWDGGGGPHDGRTSVRKLAAADFQWPCPQAAVDWSSYVDPGDAPGGVAAVFATDWRDTALVWVVHSLHALWYDVRLLVLPQHEHQADRFLARLRASPAFKGGRVDFEVTTLHGRTLSGGLAKVFVYLCSDGLPQVLGKGTANVVLMRSAFKANQATVRSASRRSSSNSTTSSSSSSSSSSTASTTTTASRKQQQQQRFDDGDAFVVSGYDFMLYSSTDELAAHAPTLTPLLEQLQRNGQLFPLLDVLPLPAAPVAQAADSGDLEQGTVQHLGVTLSMSSYTTGQRELLSRALGVFRQLEVTMRGHVRLVVCTWLMPGITEDLPHLRDQVDVLGIPEQAWEVRYESSDMVAMYEGISVQWHLHNMDVKPHFVALAGMPAGVLVLDVTGTLQKQQQHRLEHQPLASVDALLRATQQVLQQPASALHGVQARVVRKAVDPAAVQVDAKVNQVMHRSLRSKVFRFFIKSSQAAYRARLTPEVHKVRAQAATAKQGAATSAASTTAAAAGSQPGGRPTTRYAAVIVEARPHYAFLYVVLNAAWYLPGWTLHVVHTRLNADFVKRILRPHVHVTFHQLDTDNVDIDHYNLLMKNASFWQMFDADHVLLFQTDSLILRPGLERFTVFDYVGAPWHMENERWSQPALKAALPEGVGNGGFSMRSVRAMVGISTKLGPSSPLKEQEDVFYAINVRSTTTFTHSDRRSAYEFCLEVPCNDMPWVQPHALHASWYYTPFAWLQPLLDSSLYDLQKYDCTLDGIPL